MKDTKTTSQKSIENIIMQRNKLTEKDQIEAGLIDNEGKQIKIIQNDKKGRPSQYDPQTHPYQAYTMIAQMGSTLPEISAVFSISETTIQNWMRTYPEFAQAVKAGRDLFTSARIEQSLIKRALGYTYDEVTVKQTSYKKFDKETGDTIIIPVEERTVTTKSVAPDVAAIIFYLKNRKPDRWKDKQEIINVTEKRGQITESLKNLPVTELNRIRRVMKNALTNDSVKLQSPIEPEFEQIAKAENE